MTRSPNVGSSRCSSPKATSSISRSRFSPMVGDTVRDLQLYLNPQAEHLLDWFHVTMRLTVMQQTAKSLPETTNDEEMTYEIRAPVSKELERPNGSCGMGTCTKPSRSCSPSRAISRSRSLPVRMQQPGSC